jgi:mercuric ion transport protein
MHNNAAIGTGETVGRGAPALALAALAALLASSCCVLPLLLALIGISGTWTSQLRMLQPYSNVLLGLAASALALAGWRIFRRQSPDGSAADAAAACEAQGLACHTSNRAARRWFWLVVLLALVPLLVPLLAPWWFD